MSITPQEYQQFTDTQDRIHAAAISAAQRIAQALREQGETREVDRIDRIAGQAHTIEVDEDGITFTALCGGEDTDYRISSTALFDDNPARHARQIIDDRERERARQKAIYEQRERQHLKSLLAKYDAPEQRP